MKENKMTTIKRNKKFYSGFDLTMKDLTRGKILALTRALRYYDSPVGNDVLDSIRNAISDYETLSAEIESSLADLKMKMIDHKIS